MAGNGFQPDMWVTSYAGHFMIEAGRKGYNIPSGFMNRWTTFQRKEAQSWRYDAKFKQTATVQAYRLYTLALAGAPERGAMNRLRETKDIPRLAGWMLAGAYAVSGRPEAAAELIDVRTLEHRRGVHGVLLRRGGTR
jgi:alpha-2-macroglobulin